MDAALLTDRARSVADACLTVGEPETADLLRALADVLTAERKRADALTEAIREANHEAGVCARWQRDGPDITERPCTCFKALVEESSVLAVPAEQP